MIVNQTLFFSDIIGNGSIFHSSEIPVEVNITDEPHNFTTNATMGGNEPSNLQTGGIPWNLVDLFYILSRSLIAAFSLTGLLFNSIMFEATRKVNSKALKSKNFIQNAIISNIAMAVGQMMVVIGYIVQGFGTSKLVFKSVINVARHINAGTLYAQAFAGVLLAGDRMYAVVKPMTYHTVGYSAIAKICLVAISWLSAVGIMSVGLIIPFTQDRFADKPLYIKLAYGFTLFTNSAKPVIAIWMNSSIFVMYIAIFIIFILQRRMNRAVDGSTGTKAGTTLSLTLTYFLIHTTSLSLYLTGPLMKLLRDNDFLPTKTIPSKGWSAINQVYVMLYVCNSIVNPIIISSRVKLIRARLYEILRPRSAKTQPLSQKQRTKITETKTSSVNT